MIISSLTLGLIISLCNITDSSAYRAEEAQLKCQKYYLNCYEQKSKNKNVFEILEARFLAECVREK